MSMAPGPTVLRAVAEPVYRLAPPRTERRAPGLIALAWVVATMAAFPATRAVATPPAPPPAPPPAVASAAVAPATAAPDAGASASQPIARPAPPPAFAKLLADTRAAALARFAAEDARARPAPGGILFAGSSIFALWPDVARDMAPLPAFNRAIGGTTTADQLDLIDTLALPYRPRTIVFYAGSNDIVFGGTADGVVANVLRYAGRVHAALPATRFVYVTINRAPQKRDKWAIVDEANARIRAEAARQPEWFGYVDVDRLLQDARGEPLPGLYGPDGLHFLPAAYARFTAAINPAPRARDAGAAR